MVTAKSTTLQPQQKIQYASLLIRIGLAIVFVYAGVQALLHPEAWIGFIPSFTEKLVDPKLALDSISIAQLVLAAWLVWGKYARYASIIAVALLGGILVANPGTILITFRDIGLIFAAVAVIVLDL